MCKIITTKMFPTHRSTPKTIALINYFSLKEIRVKFFDCSQHISKRKPYIYFVLLQSKHTLSKEWGKSTEHSEVRY